MKLLSPSLLLCLTTLSVSIFSSPAKAVQTSDGTVAFESGILLADTHTTFSGVRIRQAIYYFDLEVPDDVGEPLQTVEINQRTGGDDIKFDLDRTKAYLGDHHRKQEQLDLTSSQDEATGAIKVKLNQPITPGKKVTIGLKPKRNPDVGGVYLFGVTAFPKGDKAVGLYLGAGRLDFHDNGDSFVE